MMHTCIQSQSKQALGITSTLVGPESTWSNLDLGKLHQSLLLQWALKGHSACTRSVSILASFIIGTLYWSVLILWALEFMAHPMHYTVVLASFSITSTAVKAHSYACICSIWHIMHVDVQSHTSCMYMFNLSLASFIAYIYFNYSLKCMILHAFTCLGKLYKSLLWQRPWKNTLHTVVQSKSW